MANVTEPIKVFVPENYLFLTVVSLQNELRISCFRKNEEIIGDKHFSSQKNDVIFYIFDQIKGFKDTVVNLGSLVITKTVPSRWWERVDTCYTDKIFLHPLNPCPSLLRIIQPPISSPKQTFI